MKKKWLVLFLLWLTFMVSYLDRVNVSTAGPLMMKDLHMDAGSFGLLLSAFTFGYGLMQIPGGMLADRFGSKATMIFGLVWWSIFTALSGVVASVGMLIAVRALFGAGEALGTGSQLKLLGKYFNGSDRNLGSSLYNTAIPLGPALCGPIAVWIMGKVGWHGLFYWFSVPGIILVVLLYWLLPSEKKEKRNSGNHVKKKDKVALKDVLKYPGSWLIFTAYLTKSVASWGLLGWIPVYLNTSRHINIKDLGFASSIPYLLGFFGLLFFGWLGSRVKHRASLIGIIYILAGAGLYFAFSAGTTSGSIVFLSVASFFIFGAYGPFWGLTLDLFPSEVHGTLSGFTNFGGQIGGFISPLVVGYLVKATGSFTDGFLFMIATLIVSSIALFGLDYLKIKMKQNAIYYEEKVAE
ncbi:MFS transporter [Neobacillus cucumis]|uniref:MFS transporter n=1 Tax=Neobacillus cucumis TaxID=1740721 RepID=UPI002E202FE2|nr:MFS transporter [Neobacillus cucumis]